jgi:hypothetical protein
MQPRRNAATIWTNLGIIIIGLSVLLGIFGANDVYESNEVSYRETQKEPPFNPLKMARLSDEELKAYSPKQRAEYLKGCEERDARFAAKYKAKTQETWRATQNRVAVGYLGYALVTVAGIGIGVALIRLDRPKNAWRPSGTK